MNGLNTIKPHNCQHPWQDKTYGKGMRVMNQYKDGWRCTVCGKEVGKTVAEKKVVEEKK